MLKKYVEIRNADGVLIQVCEVKECEPLEFLKLSREAKENRERLEREEDVRLTNIEKDIKVLKGEE